MPRAEHEPERVDVIALTHGHGDHVGDTVELDEEVHARRSSRYSSCTAGSRSRAST